MPVRNGLALTDPARANPAGRIRIVLRRGRWSLPLLALLGLLAALDPGPARADAADFQGMPGMWKVNLAVHRDGQVDQKHSYWFCADEGSDPMDSFAAIELPGLEACTRQSTRRSTTSLAWTLQCQGLLAGRGRISFDSAEHYRGQLMLPGSQQTVQLEARRYAACTGPSD